METKNINIVFIDTITSLWNIQLIAEPSLTFTELRRVVTLSLVELHSNVISNVPAYDSKISYRIVCGYT